MTLKSDTNGLFIEGMTDSAELANYAARIVVSHFGTWPINIKSLINKMGNNG